jgi:tetratricopeptide (TPR) repeat protein
MKIVLSYRRSDAPGMAGRIRDWLAQHYGDGNVFMDIDSIPPGVNFREYIEEQLKECDVLLAIIGPRWIGQRRGKPPRIKDEDDWVRIEVETALQRDIPVVPVLVEGAAIPRPNQLPETLQPLLRRNAASVGRGRDFHAHVGHLIRSLDRLLSAATGAVRDAPQPDRKDHIRREPKTADTYLVRGDTHLEKGEFDRAIADYTEAIRLDPEDPISYNNRGFAYRNKDDLDRALADFNEAIHLAPKYAVAYNNRGDIYWEKDEFDRAIADYSEAIRLDPQYAVAYNNRGLAYEDKGDLDRALADYEAVLRINPQEPDIRSNRNRVRAALRAKR